MNLASGRSASATLSPRMIAAYTRARSRGDASSGLAAFTPNAPRRRRPAGPLDQIGCVATSATDPADHRTPCSRHRRKQGTRAAPRPCSRSGCHEWHPIGRRRHLLRRTRSTAAQLREGWRAQRDAPTWLLSAYSVPFTGLPRHCLRQPRHRQRRNRRPDTQLAVRHQATPHSSQSTNGLDPAYETRSHCRPQHRPPPPSVVRDQAGRRCCQVRATIWRWAGCDACCLARLGGRQP
jgi:hypothetical protein